MRSPKLQVSLCAILAACAAPAYATCVDLPISEVRVIGELRLGLCDSFLQFHRVPADSQVSLPVVIDQPIKLDRSTTDTLSTLQAIKQSVALDKSGLVKNFSATDRGNVSYQLRLRGNGDLKVQIKVAFD
jgi:hypothetical protein